MGHSELHIDLYLTGDSESHEGALEEIFNSNTMAPRNEYGSTTTYAEVDPDVHETEFTWTKVAKNLRTTKASAKISRYGSQFSIRYINEGGIDDGSYVLALWSRAYFSWAHNTEEERQENALAVANTVEDIYDVLDPLFVWGFMSSPDELWNPTLETTVQRVTDGHVDALGWLTVFPPAAVQRYGRDAVLSAPAWEVRELDDGGVMLVTNPTPVDFGAVAETARDIAEHLASISARMACPAGDKAMRGRPSRCERHETSRS